MASKKGAIENEILDSVENSPEFIKKVQSIADEAASKLVSCINESIGASAHSEDLGEAKIASVNVNGLEATIEVNISNGEYHESLAPKKYGGIDDMTSLFDKGYTANKQIFGIWHGEHIGSLTHRKGEGFIEAGIRAFKSSGGKGYTVIDEEHNTDRFK